MGTRFLSDNEILTVAMNIEEDGHRFYDAVARNSKRKETNEIFERLRDEEMEHKKTFKEMLDSLSKSDSYDYFGISEDIASYLRALVDTGVFKNTDAESIKKLNEIKALEIGIQAEKDSVLFYSEAQKSSVNPKARDIINTIIEVEKGHIVSLVNRLRVARKLF